MARRRELIVVNGHNLDQVAGIGSLVAGSFYVDQGADQITVWLPDGVEASEAIFEVGVRPRLFDSLHWPDVMLRGLTFENAVPTFTSAGVLVGTRTTLVDVTVRRSGQIGMYVEGDDISIWRSRFNDNGGDGFLFVRVRRIELISSETSHNNWRGRRGDFYEWAVGQKLARVHDARIINHTSIGNWSRGLWLDWDNMNVTIEGLTSCGNRNDGLRIEANQGPVRVIDSVICENRAFGISGNGSRSVELSGNLIADNQRGGIHLEGEERRVGSMDGHTYVVNLEDWRVLDNVVSSNGSASLWSVAFWDIGKRTHYFSTSEFDRNAYSHPTISNPFVLLAAGDARLTFPQWQVFTAMEGSSSFE